MLSRNREIFVMAVAHALQFKAAFRRVEAGMQDRAVGLAGARQDVGALFYDEHARAAERQPSRGRAADHAGADHREIEKF